MSLAVFWDKSAIALAKSLQKIWKVVYVWIVIFSILFPISEGFEQGSSECKLLHNCRLHSKREVNVVTTFYPLDPCSNPPIFGGNIDNMTVQTCTTFQIFWSDFTSTIADLSQKAAELTKSYIFLYFIELGHKSETEHRTYVGKLILFVCVTIHQ